MSRIGADKPATPKKTTARKPRKVSRQRVKAVKPQRSWLKKLAWFGLKLSLVVSVLLLSYGIYLDQKLMPRFQGQTWHLPAQVFSRALHLYPQAPVTHAQLVAELKLLGYRQVASPQQVGEFAVSRQKIDLWRRGFVHPQGEFAAQRVMLEFTPAGLHQIRDQSQQLISTFYLEPQLLDRIMSVSSDQDRVFTPLVEIPQSLIKALLFTEDRNFYQHHGINPVAIVRALIANLNAGRAVQGGSTLTQQLAKNLFLTRERTLLRKFQEAVMAVIIDARYSKAQILEIYLNEIYMGQDGKRAIHGVGLAAQHYFGRPLAELTIEQQALLVAVIKGPSYYNPWRYPERVQQRRDHILHLLMQADFIPAQLYAQAAAAPLNLRQGKQKGIKQKLPAFFAKVRQELQSFYGKTLFRQSGIKVFTSLDPLAQKQAETAAANTLKGMANKNPDLQIGMVVVDRQTAQITAMVGDKSPEFSGFNRALDIRRPIGSLVKPFVYLTALNHQQYTLATPLADQPITLTNRGGQTWSPQNVDKKFRGQVPLLQALTDSLNVPTVNLGMKVGLDKVADTLRYAGWHETIPNYPSMLLGALNGSPMMVAQIYQTLADGGRYRPLSSIVAVLDEHNLPIPIYGGHSKQAWPQSTDYLVQYALTQVIQKGTAKRLGQAYPSIQLAGKTGTSNDKRDSWFAGFDALNLAAIWVGQDDNGKTSLYGSNGAMAVYQNFLAQRPPRSLELPVTEGVIQGYFDLADGKAIEAHCDSAVMLPTLRVSYRPQANCGEPLSWWQQWLQL